MFDDEHDVVVETHVQHTVGLIEYQVFQSAQFHVPHFDVRHHLARCTDHQVGPLAERLLLLHKGIAITAAIYRDRAYRCEIGKTFQVLCDLDGQFPRGHHHQRIIGVILVRRTDDLMNQRQQKGGCFTGTRLGRSDHILALHHQGNHLFLYRRGVFITGSVDAFHQAWVETEFCKFQAVVF